MVAALGGVAFAGYCDLVDHGTAPRYHTARVERGPLTESITLTGNLSAVNMVEVRVDEADRIRIGHQTPVTFTVHDLPGQTLTGRVARIRWSPRVAGGVDSCLLVITVTSPSARLVRGMTASVSFVTVRKPDVLRVPNAALRFRPLGHPPTSPERVVWVLRDGRPESIPVTLGITDGSFTEIVPGDLDAGHALIVGLEKA